LLAILSSHTTSAHDSWSCFTQASTTGVHHLAPSCRLWRRSPRAGRRLSRRHVTGATVFVEALVLRRGLFDRCSCVARRTLIRVRRCISYRPLSGRTRRRRSRVCRAVVLGVSARQPYSPRPGREPCGAPRASQPLHPTSRPAARRRCERLDARRRPFASRQRSTPPPPSNDRAAALQPPAPLAAVALAHPIFVSTASRCNLRLVVP